MRVLTTPGPPFPTCPPGCSWGPVSASHESLGNRLCAPPQGSSSGSPQAEAPPNPPPDFPPTDPDILACSPPCHSSLGLHAPRDSPAHVSISPTKNQWPVRENRMLSLQVAAPGSEEKAFLSSGEQPTARPSRPEDLCWTQPGCLRPWPSTCPF